MAGTRRRAFDLVAGLLWRGLGGDGGGVPADPGSAPRAAWDEAVRVAATHRVAPALGAALARLGAEAPPGEAGPLLAFLRKRNRERNSALRAALLATATELNGIGVEPVVLKGGIRLLDDLYPDPSWRFVGDLDLLVPADRAAEAQALLVGRGYAPLEPEVPAPADHHHLAQLLHPAVRVAVELHHDVLVPRFARLLPAPAVAAEAAAVEVGGARLRLPRAAHQLVHLVAHGQLHHERHFAAGLSLRDLLEARLLVRRCGADGPAALRAAFAAAGWGRAADAYLALLDRHLADGPPAAAPGVGTRFLLAWADLNLASARAAAASDLAGFYRAAAGRLAASGAARSRLLRGLRDPAYLGRRGAELARLCRGLAAGGGA